MILSSRWRRRGIAAGSLVLCWFAFLGPAIPSDVALLERDLLHTALPWRTFMAEQLRSGHLPQWYPFDGLGAPFIGQIVTAVFHPATLLYLVLPAVVALKWNVLLAFAIALAGAWRAARAFGASRLAAFAAATAFSFGGYTVGLYDNPPYMQAIATLPWVLAAAVRLRATHRWRHTALLGLMWALVLLGGDAQSFLLVPLLMLPLLWESTSRRTFALRLGVSAIIAVLVSAIILVPAWKLLGDASRGTWSAFGGQEAAWAFHPRRLLNLVIADFLPPDWHASTSVLLLGGKPGVWAETLFTGGLPLLLLLAGLSRRRLAIGFAAVGLLSMLLALGPNGLLPLAARIIPLLAKFRFPEKYLSIAWIAAIPLIAFGFDRVSAAPRQFIPLGIIGAGLCGGLAILARGERLAPMLMTKRDPPLDTAFSTALQAAWAHGATVTAIGLVGVTLVLTLSVRSKQWIVLLAAGAFLEPWMGNASVVRLAPASVLDGKTSFDLAILAARSDGEPPARLRNLAPMLGIGLSAPDSDEERARYLREVAYPDTSGLDGIAPMGSGLPAVSLREDMLLSGQAGPRSVVDGLVNGCFVVDKARGDLDVVAASSTYDLVLGRIPCRPRAYLAATHRASGLSAAVEAVKKGLPDRAAVWEGGPDFSSSDGRVRWSEYSPERLVLDIDAPNPTALVINDSIRAGWDASLDGSPVPIHATNVAVRGIEVPAGAHQVKLGYSTPGLVWGAVLSAFGLLLALVLATVADREQRE